MFTLFVALLLVAEACCFNYDYTISVMHGRRECFYQPIVGNKVKVEFEYQVLDMTPINYHIKSPKGVLMVTDVRKPSNIIELTLDERGIYEICVLNRYDNSPKQVYLSIYSEEEDKNWPFSHIEALEDKLVEAEAEIEMTASAFLAYTDRVTSAIQKMRYLQTSHRTSNVKDYIVQMKNLTRVSRFSAVQMAVMVLTSIVQVITIRRLFGSNVSEARKMKMST